MCVRAYVLRRGEVPTDRRARHQQINVHFLGWLLRLFPKQHRTRGCCHQHNHHLFHCREYESSTKQATTMVVVVVMTTMMLSLLLILTHPSVRHAMLAKHSVLPDSGKIRLIHWRSSGITGNVIRRGVLGRFCICRLCVQPC